MIYLDNAATSWPKAETVYQTMDQFMRNKGGNPGRGSHSLAEAATSIVEETRMLVAHLVNAPEMKRIIFTLNCTDALNIALKGLLKRGDHVITDSFAHNSVVRPLRKLRDYRGIKITQIPHEPETGLLSLAKIRSAINRDTRLIVISHASNVNGVVQPVEDYGKVARESGLILLVDAAQTAGEYPIDVQVGNIDLLAFSGHKGLLGPPGTGILYVGERAELDTLREGGTGSYSEYDEQPGVLPDRYECGTLNSVGIAGLGAGLKFIFNEGLEKIRIHNSELIERLISGLSGVPGINLYKAKDLSWQAPVISFNLTGYEPGEIGNILDQAFDIKVRAGLHCAPSAHRLMGTYPRGTVRVSPGYFNTTGDIDFTIEAITKISGAKRISKHHDIAMS